MILNKISIDREMYKEREREEKQKEIPDFGDHQMVCGSLKGIKLTVDMQCLFLCLHSLYL